MKKWIAMIAACSLLATTALAAPGDANDPVISESYVNQVFRPQLVETLEQKGPETLGETYRQGMLDLVETIGTAQQTRENQGNTARKGTGTVLLKAGDVVTLEPGTQLFVQWGGVTNNSQNLVDITNGQAAAQGALSVDTRYMMGAKTGTVTVTSTSCQVTIHGVYTCKASLGVDYGSMAVALQTMGIFQGMESGFQLETGATRVQGLVMFLRILGLEDEALACSGITPFADVPANHWAAPYVAYAYQQGLTTGISATAFGTDHPMTAQHYLTFLMRALSYEETTEFSYGTALADATKLGLFTQKEVNTLSSGTFLRRNMAYCSFYSLFAMDQKTDQLLMEKLVAEGTIKAADLYDGLCQVQGGQI